jgi:hypothetical protein
MREEIADGLGGLLGTTAPLQRDFAEDREGFLNLVGTLSLLFRLDRELLDLRTEPPPASRNRTLFMQSMATCVQNTESPSPSCPGGSRDATNFDPAAGLE